MVTIRPKPDIEVLCNGCETKIGIINNGIFEAEDKTPDTFMRFRMYDIEHDGLPLLLRMEYEIDLCEKCIKTFEPIIKKLGFTKSKVKKK